MSQTKFHVVGQAPKPQTAELKFQSHELITDAADCMQDAYTTLNAVSKKNPLLAAELEFLKARILSMKNELTVKAGSIHADSHSRNSGYALMPSLPWNTQVAAG